MADYKIVRVVSVNPSTKTVTLLGSKPLPDWSNGQLRSGDWAMVVDGGARELSSDWFKDRPEVLTIK